MSAMRIPGRLAVGVAGLSMLSVANADEITETEFLSSMTDDHPATVVLGDELVGARADGRTPRSENPSLSFEREAPESTPAQSTLKLSWRPPLDGRRNLANASASAALAAAEQRLDRRRLRLRDDLRALFARWSRRVERRALFADLEDRVQRLASRVRARASSGEESGLDARRLELAASKARSGLAIAQADVVRVLAEVHAVFPALDVTRHPTRPALPPMSATPDLSARADLVALEHEVERAALSRRLAGRVLEFPSLVGGWTAFDEKEGRIEGPLFGIEWSLPLFDRAQGERARSSGEATLARARLELGRARATAELRSSTDAYEHLRVVAGEVLENTGDTGAIVDAATAEFQAGESTLTDLLETLRSVTDARLAALDLYHEALAAHRVLEMSVGRPLTSGEPR